MYSTVYQEGQEGSTWGTFVQFGVKRIYFLFVRNFGEREPSICHQTNSHYPWHQYLYNVCTDNHGTLLLQISMIVRF